jgi:hypothetical protein
MISKRYKHNVKDQGRTIKLCLNDLSSTAKKHSIEHSIPTTLGSQRSPYNNKENSTEMQTNNWGIVRGTGIAADEPLVWELGIVGTGSKVGRVGLATSAEGAAVGALAGRIFNHSL